MATFTSQWIKKVTDPIRIGVLHAGNGLFGGKPPSSPVARPIVRKVKV
jgi:hypothetical protein